MIRKIIKIDKEKCNGCGLCVSACHEGAIEMIDGKATLSREDFCDGLGDCLPACPAEAISFEEREAPEYNSEAVERAKAKVTHQTLPGGCPGVLAKSIKRASPVYTKAQIDTPSRLAQWPCQIKLVPVNAPYFDGANLLVAADCTAFSYGGFHEDFMKNRITLIGCSKLDDVDYSEKLTAIIKNNNIKSITIVRMEVPCCSGIENAVRRAIMNSGKDIPAQVVIISTDGKILE
ncbi:MAG: 4Fe-4S binding protein [Clostridia bacterium]|nr:4Fe-4S binding protein [Clostridia bacterium]